MDDWLAGGRVQRVRLGRAGAREVALLAVRVPSRTVHLVLAGGLGIGVVDEPGRERVRDALGSEGYPPQAHWRARLEAARVTGASAREVRLARDTKAWRAAVRGGSTELVLEGCDASEMRSGATPADEQALTAAGDGILAQLTEGADAGRAQSLARAIARAAARVRRRRDAIQGDISRAREAEAKARGAELFVAEAARAPRGATQLVAVDWSDGSPREIVFPLDPARGPREQLEALFRKARRMKEGARIAEARLAEADRVLASLAAISTELASPAGVDVAALEARARSAAPRDLSLPSSRIAPSRRGPAKQPPLPPYRTFLSTSGARILVGRGAEKNDALTFHVARPHDLWLHAKGRTGAHIVVPLTKGASCPAEVLVEAAHLAAHFSEAKPETAVEVQHTPRRYLRKPKGSAPGLVVVDREKVMLLRRDEALLRKLLEREEI